MLSFACWSGRSGTVGLKKIAVLCAATMLAAGCGHREVRGNNPAQPGPDQQVHLVWQANGWMVALGNASPVKPSDAHTKLDKGVGPTKFVVDIVGNTSASFKSQGALTAWTTGSKSQPQQGINSTQLLGPVLTNDGKLVFYNLNQGNPVTIYYALHFNNGVPDVDPIMDNGGSS